MFTESLAPFFADFSAAVTIGGSSASAIFDAGYARGDVGLVGMAGSAPTLMLPTADVASDVIGQTAVVGLVNYTVVEHQPDGTGVSTLVLERQ